MKGRKPETVTAGSHPITTVPTPPTWLSKDAKAEWRRVAPVLVERGVLTIADLGTLEGFCVAQGLIRSCQRVRDTEGDFYTAPTGPKRHPAVTTQDAALKTARLFAAELGLTPYARSRTAIAGDGIREASDTDDLGL
ncbi:phage terminase small subunit P27 family [Fulvimarina sp. 2208YS6-2-32]|uniref:Phage terminase small subunit P27 family n=1 Tax=Fulvimarina uroteuthidis TaxID=3098149 RepID=A0ABU5I703_9HYPH|nr:phage terminase small subunit P27 family [Fulvimarina sp. 2208YS6-2-32]MDY8111164.1 phage terminase small subunit P27 family [Fulvimarina sp. 2208YS6-2-32]